MRFKIQPSSKHLCQTCSYGQVLLQGNRERTICQQMFHPHAEEIRGSVSECTRYHERNAGPSIPAMEKMAYVLSTDIKTGKIGFYRPLEYERLMKEGVVK